MAQEAQADSVAENVRRYERQFLEWNGNINLLKMSKALSAAHFRHYISLSRELRLANRGK